MAAVEVERKWLVADSEAIPAQALAAPAATIEQGYLTLAADGGETRVRRRDGSFTLTVKSGRGMVRGEAEIELSAQQFERLWPATEGARVQKRRHAIPLPDGLLIELDIYAGTLCGLIVAEVEFTDASAAERFVAPAWFTREVTDDDAYKNRSLATGGRPA